MALEHPDIHLYVPLPRPKGVSGDRLADALETARIDALEEFRAQALRPSSSDESRGLYLSLIRALRKRAQVRPSMAPVQVFVITDAEYLVPQEASPEAANALLKLLEEPPPATRFILTSSEPGRLLPTIRSRSVPLHLSRLDEDVVAAFLQRHCDVSAETASWAARLSQGSIGRALGFLPDGEDRGPMDVRRREAFDLVKAALAAGRADGYAVALGYSPARARSLVELFSYVEEWLRDLSAVAAGAEEQVLSQDALPSLRTLVEGARLDPTRVAAALPAVEEARELARGNVNPQLLLTGLMRRIGQALETSPYPRTTREIAR
jgi:DNA polymerase-3 subunit delta'